MKSYLILTESALMLLHAAQVTVEEAGAQIIRPARGEQRMLDKDEGETITKMQDAQTKFREGEMLLRQIVNDGKHH